MGLTPAVPGVLGTPAGGRSARTTAVSSAQAGKHDTDRVTQVVQVQPTRGVVLGQQRD